MEKDVKYIVYYKDERISMDMFQKSEPYDNLEKAVEIREIISKENHIFDSHIKIVTTIKETAEERVGTHEFKEVPYTIEIDWKNGNVWLNNHVSKEKLVITEKDSRSINNAFKMLLRRNENGSQ